MAGVHHRNWRRKRPRARPLAMLLLAFTGTSCVPVAMSTPLRTDAAVIRLGDPEPVAPAAMPAMSADSEAAPTATLASAGSHVFQGRTPLDQLRSLDCLAQAIYYEAGSESEDGQRAVAQVVLNRVRHPAWPNTVCGVVYQGPMRAGGGCQFTFTCDGSLMRSAGGPAWIRARQLAAEALAGRAFAPVGLSTHYHTTAVFPSWAPRLARTALIGAHQFYALPGQGGGAFSVRYAGGEPLARPNPILFPRAALQTRLAALIPVARAETRAPVPSDIAPNPRWTVQNLPESTIREEFRNTGQWRDDAPGAITGRR
ncbi:cell wall hydrolase [Sphingosinicella sp.]|uniref:cell wall hydrolase n=1 Tax=Sphingosinicella sp. TaxID=1917971 RepID=UPI004037ECA0